MREIKFRAWSKLTSSMSPAVAFTEWIRQYQLQPDALPQTHFKYENAVLMQFTGLLDRNGKEIYEGDVVYETIWQSEQKKGINHEIKWSDVNGGFWMGTSHHLNKGTADDLEVLGNIYESPELLATPHNH